MDEIEKRILSNGVLERDDLTHDQKLFIILQCYKEELAVRFPQLYYASLAWKDCHLKELFGNKIVEDYLTKINGETS